MYEEILQRRRRRTPYKTKQLFTYFSNQSFDIADLCKVMPNG